MQEVFKRWQNLTLREACVSHQATCPLITQTESDAAIKTSESTLILYLAIPGATRNVIRGLLIVHRNVDALCGSLFKPRAFPVENGKDS